MDNLIRGAAKKFHEQLKKQSTSLYHNFSIFKYLITIVVECVSYNLTQEQSDFFFSIELWHAQTLSVFHIWLQ